MRNVVYYYYGINISDIYKNENYYHFNIDGSKYILFKNMLGMEQLNTLYNISQMLFHNGVPMHTIIKTRNGNYNIEYNGINYVLMKVNFDLEVKNIILDDIIDFSNKSIMRNTPINYIDVWSRKIDYIEYQISEMGKDYPEIRDSIAYFIGLAETAISINYQIKSEICSIGHKKMSKDPHMFYNPLNLVIDNRVRDVAEFFKIELCEKNFNCSIFLNCINGLSNNELLIMFSRIIFPNYYFDLVEKCLLDGISDVNIKKVVDNIAYFEEELKYIYYLLPSRPIIEWIEKT